MRGSRDKVELCSDIAIQDMVVEMPRFAPLAIRRIKAAHKRREAKRRYAVEGWQHHRVREFAFWMGVQEALK